jgi:hypothetical protein
MTRGTKPESKQGQDDKQGQDGKQAQPSKQGQKGDGGGGLSICTWWLAAGCDAARKEMSPAEGLLCSCSCGCSASNSCCSWQCYAFQGAPTWSVKPSGIGAAYRSNNPTATAVAAGASFMPCVHQAAGLSLSSS